MKEKQPNFSRLLVGTDDSRDAQLAFKYAINYAAKMTLNSLSSPCLKATK